MGDFEVVKETLTPLGAHFGHVAMQPGGPQGTAVVNEVPVLSFPGNPVSTMVLLRGLRTGRTAPGRGPARDPARATPV